MNEKLRKGPAPLLTDRDKYEIRLNREAGIPVKECAALAGVSVATAMRALADLRRKLGPEKFARNGHRARSYLTTGSQVRSSETA